MAMYGKNGVPLDITKKTPAMLKALSDSESFFGKESDGAKASRLHLRENQKQGGVAEHLCRVEDKLDRILSILNNSNLLDK